MRSKVGSGAGLMTYAMASLVEFPLSKLWEGMVVMKFGRVRTI